MTIGSANGNYSVLGAGPSDSRGRVDTNYQLFGNVSYVKGRHSFKMGYEWRRTFINSFIDGGHRGSLTFNSLQDFLAGTVDGGSSAAGYSTRYTYQNDSGAYFQDSWRLSNRITLNYGLRWDYFGVVGENNHNFSLFNPVTDALENVGPGGLSQLYPKDWTNFSPRISAADDVFGDGKLVLRTGIGIFYDGASQDFFVGNQPWNTSAAQAGPAFNYVSFASSTIPTLAPGVQVFNGYTQTGSAFTVAQNLQTPRYVSYNFNVESQVAKRIAVQIGYVGSQGRHLFRLRDLNQINIDTTPQRCANGQMVQPGNSCFSNFVYVNQEETSAISNYNSLQTALKLQNWHGLTSTLNYTWSHSIDTASDGLDFVPDSSMPEDSFNPHADRANSNFDVRQRVQWYWNYAIPNLTAAKWITNGWALDGMYNFATGQPFTVNYVFENAYDPSYLGFNGSGEDFGRPDIVGNPHQGTGGLNLLNLNAFAAPCTLQGNACVNGHAGSEGRNAFRATNYTNFDFSLSKNNQLTEKVKMELRADFFNIFNHPNFTNPLLPSFAVDVFGNAQPSGNRLLAGVTPNATNKGGQFLQPTATPDVGSGNPFLGGGGPRGMQLAVHFTF